MWLQEEWEKDRQGLPALTFRVFYNAVFELVGTTHAPRSRLAVLIVCGCV